MENACLAGKMTVNTRFGTKVAVLAGDFLFAQSSWFLANLDNLEVRLVLLLLSVSVTCILAWDVLLSHSFNKWCLWRWGSESWGGIQVIKLISQVIADFASGEISQQEYQFDTDITLQQYLDKSFYKTATLIAASCKSAAAFSDVPVEVSSCLASRDSIFPLRLS